MNWKKLQIWIKGGIIASILNIILVVFSYISSSPGEGRYIALSIVEFPYTFIFGMSSEFEMIVGGLISYLLIGALIGYLISKFKKVNKPKKKR